MPQHPEGRAHRRPPPACPPPNDDDDERQARAGPPREHHTVGASPSTEPRFQPSLFASPAALLPAPPSSSPLLGENNASDGSAGERQQERLSSMRGQAGGREGAGR